jgi:salicylate hydroxylase
VQGIIAGGGVGGLSAGLGLARAGWAVTVLEQAEALRETGAGLQLSPNAVKALRYLGVDPQAANPSAPQALELRLGATGERIFAIKMGESAERRYGAPYLHVHRADLHAALHAACVKAGVRVRLDTRVSGFTSDRGEVRVGLDSGEVIVGDLLVGADGIRSAVRAQMIGPDLPHYTGCLAWRAVIAAARLEGDPPPPSATVWAGPGRHAVTYRIRGGDLINFVGVVESPRRAEEGWDEAGEVDRMQADFAGFAAPVKATLAAATGCMRRGLYDRDPLPSWSAGRVTLLGDACHPMPPFQAQGAAMALEDAVVLARALAAQGGSIEAALQSYGQARRARTSRVLASARANKAVFHRTHPALRAATYGPMRLADRFAPAFVAGRQDWIYAYDPATAPLR